MARWAEALAESTRLTRLMAVLWMQARQMFERGGGEPGGLLEHGSGAGTEAHEGHPFAKRRGRLCDGAFEEELEQVSVCERPICTHVYRQRDSE